MPGPSVMIRILADAAGLGKSVDDVGAKGSTAASHMQSAFSGVLGVLNQTGVLGPFQEVLEGAEKGLDKIVESGKKVGPALLGAGAAVTGVGLALQTMGSKDAAAHQQLQQAAEATGKRYEGFNEDVESAIKAQEKFGTTANTTQDVLRVLTQATNDPAKAMDYLGTAANLAAARHIDLTSAAELLGKAYNGNTRVMKEFGVTVEKTKDTQKELTSATKAHDSAVSAEVSTQRAMTEQQAAYDAANQTHNRVNHEIGRRTQQAKRGQRQGICDNRQSHQGASGCRQQDER